jgi:hypothetical protein
MTIDNNSDNTIHEGAAALDYGSYVVQGFVSDTDNTGRQQSITTTARSGHITRTNGNYFESVQSDI